MNNFDLLVPRDNIYELPNKKGVYVLLSDENISIYVGQSVNVKQRVLEHFTGKGYNMSTENVERVYAVGIILCSESDSLNEVEQKYISLLKPILNVDKVDYAKEIDIRTLKKHGSPSFLICKYYDIYDIPCDKLSISDGYCHRHNPNKIIHQSIPSWIVHGKLITTEMQRLLINSEYKRQELYFYMSNTTFGKLLQEKTFAEIDYINEEVVLKFKKHFIVIDEDETIRLHNHKPYNI